MEIGKLKSGDINILLLMDGLKNCTIHSTTSEYNVGLVKGKSGLILSWLFCYIFTTEQRFLDIAVNLLSSQLKYDKRDLTLGSGMAGCAWLISIMKKMKCAPINVDNWLSEMEPLMNKECLLMINDNNFDYFNGASGIIFYILNKDEFSSEDISIISKYIETLEKNQKSESSFRYKKEDAEDQIILNLGVPHGITGIILILLLIKEKTQMDLKIDSLINNFVGLLIKNIKNQKNQFYFPSYIIEGKQSYSPSVLAWCYGDLTSCYAIFKTGILLNNSAFKKFGLNILTKTTQRNDSHNSSTILCHGSSSMICIYNELFNQTGNPIFREASLRWKLIAYSEFHRQYDTKNISIESTSNSFLKNPSLFMGFPGFFLSQFLDREHTINEWKNCLLL